MHAAFPAISSCCSALVSGTAHLGRGARFNARVRDDHQQPKACCYFLLLQLIGGSSDPTAQFSLGCPFQLETDSLEGTGLVQIKGFGKDNSNNEKWLGKIVIQVCIWHQLQSLAMHHAR
jgi:hypothetical protein